MTNTVLTDEQKAQFVTDIADYCTGFVSPLFAVVDAIEQAVLQSPEVQTLKKDAERYRFIRAKVYASNAYGRASWKFHYDNLPLPLDNPTRGSVKQHFEDAIDLAICLEENGNTC